MKESEKERQREREKERQRDRETERQRDRETERQTERQTDIFLTISEGREINFLYVLLKCITKNW